MMRTYYRHNTSSDFCRIITTVYYAFPLFFPLLDYRGQCQRYCFVQYGFHHQENPIELKPHDNSEAFQSIYAKYMYI